MNSQANIAGIEKNSLKSTYTLTWWWHPRDQKSKQSSNKTRLTMMQSVALTDSIFHNEDDEYVIVQQPVVVRDDDSFNEDYDYCEDVYPFPSIVENFSVNDTPFEFRNGGLGNIPIPCLSEIDEMEKYDEHISEIQIPEVYIETDQYMLDQPQAESTRIQLATSSANDEKSETKSEISTGYTSPEGQVGSTSRKSNKKRRKQMKLAKKAAAAAVAATHLSQTSTNMSSPSRMNKGISSLGKRVSGKKVANIVVSRAIPSQYKESTKKTITK